MANLINKIELLIKREKRTPDKNIKSEDSKKTSNEILTELFGVFNAAPPKIDEEALKKKKSKKKHKKEKKKRSRSSSSDSDTSSQARKKKKKKSKKRRYSDHDKTPPLDDFDIKSRIKVEGIKKEHKQEIKYEDEFNLHSNIKNEKDDTMPSIKSEKKQIIIDVNDIPLPESPKSSSKVDTNDLRLKLDSKNKIQIKNLKFSSVFEETVKKAEEELRKKAERCEEGECSDSGSESLVEESNSQFPKSSDPSGILKKKASEISSSDRSKRKHSESSRKSSHRDRERSRSRRRSRSSSRLRRHRSSSRSRHRSRYSRSPGRYRSERSRSRNRKRSPRRIRRSRSRSPLSSGVKLKDSEKKRLLEVARKNAINMLRNGAVPAGAAALPLHTRNQVMAAIQSGGKSVDELTDFCKHLSKKEALGELSSASEDDMSENEDTKAFHHPFLVKDKAPIVMNIRGGVPLPVKSTLPVANKEELRIQFPVSSGSQHRDKTSEWVPVSPKNDNEKNLQVAKLNAAPKPTVSKTAIATTTEKTPKSIQPALPAPLPALPAPPPVPAILNMPFYAQPAELNPPSVDAPPPPPGPQAYPPALIPRKPDISAIVAEKLALIRKNQEINEGKSGFGLGRSRLGAFTGSTGANILTPRELASGTQAWAKKPGSHNDVHAAISDQLLQAAPVLGGMGMHLLQKMGWTPGKGLGKEGTGTLQPLLLEVKLDTKGLQAKEETGLRANKMKARNLATSLRRGGGGGGPAAAATAAANINFNGKHPVSLLGEYCSKNKLGPPEYNLCFECGPDHKKNFLFKVKIAGTEYQPSVASCNKKQAKADAAQVALQKLGVMP